MHDRQIQQYLPFAIKVAEATLCSKHKKKQEFHFTKKWRAQFSNFSGACANASFKSIVAQYCEAEEADIPLKEVMIMIDQTVQTKREKSDQKPCSARTISDIETELFSENCSKSMQREYITAAAALKYAMDIFRWEDKKDGESASASE